METNIDLKNIWQQQNSEQPDFKELLEKLSRYKKSNLRKLAFTNIILLLTCAFILFIWFYFQPQLVTTKIGIVICVLGMLIYLLFYNKFSRNLKTIDSTDSNHEYIQNLNALVVKQRFMQTTMFSLYFAMLSIGLSLYFIEYTLMMSLFWACFTYLMTFTWLAINWLYFRPRVIKKQSAKLDELISAFKHLNAQWPEDKNNNAAQA